MKAKFIFISCFLFFYSHIACAITYVDVGIHKAAIFIPQDASSDKENMLKDIKERNVRYFILDYAHIPESSEKGFCDLFEALGAYWRTNKYKVRISLRPAFNMLQNLDEKEVEVLINIPTNRVPLFHQILQILNSFSTNLSCFYWDSSGKQYPEECLVAMWQGALSLISKSPNLIGLTLIYNNACVNSSTFLLCQELPAALQDKLVLKQLYIKVPMAKEILSQVLDTLLTNGNKGLTKLGFGGTRVEYDANLGGKLAQLVGKNSNLRYLSLAEYLYSDTDLGPVDTMDDAAAEVLAEGLRNHPKLEGIIISALKIPFRGTEAIISSLQTNRSLKRLSISWNHVGDQGAELLAKIVEINSGLRILEFSFCNIKRSGLITIAKVLTQKNFSLVDIQGNYQSLGEMAGELSTGSVSREEQKQFDQLCALITARNRFIETNRQHLEHILAKNGGSEKSIPVVEWLLRTNLAELTELTDDEHKFSNDLLAKQKRIEEMLQVFLKTTSDAVSPSEEEAIIIIPKPTRPTPTKPPKILSEPVSATTAAHGEKRGLEGKSEEEVATKKSATDDGLKERIAGQGK